MCSSDLVLPMMTVYLMTVTTASNHASLTMYHALGLPTYLMLPLMCIMAWDAGVALFPTCFRVLQLSDLFLKKWRSKNHGKLNRLSLTSCQPLRIQVGSFYAIEPSTVVAYFGYVMTYTINLLISLH